MIGMKRSIERVKALLEGINKEAGPDTVHCIKSGERVRVVKNLRLLEEVEVGKGDDLRKVVDILVGDYSKV
jgi:hypothetical protein